ncbi:Ras- C3 botulinum toxin substrate 3 [Balamuthia mandrillaris]
MQHIKCVVVGDGTVGKTCLLIAYTMKAFPTDYVPTVFDNYNAVVMYDGMPVNLGLWDTAGQDDFQAMRPMSYNNADIFLVFFAIDNPVSFQNVKEKWMDEINKTDPHTPRLLVGTKCDCRDDPERLEALRAKGIEPISWKQGKKMAKDCGCVSYIECSAIKKKGFRDVFGQTISAIINLRKGKRPGKDCWSTNCTEVFKVLNKKNKCIRCQHQFCNNCVVLFPKDHEFSNKIVCRKCRDITDDEPITRPFTKKRAKTRSFSSAGSNDVKSEEVSGAGGDGAEGSQKDSDIMPLDKARIEQAMAQQPINSDTGSDWDSDSDEGGKGKGKGKGKKKKKANLKGSSKETLSRKKSEKKDSKRSLREEAEQEVENGGEAAKDSSSSPQSNGLAHSQQ